MYGSIGGCDRNWLPERVGPHGERPRGAVQAALGPAGGSRAQFVPCRATQRPPCSTHARIGLLLVGATVAGRTCR